MSDIIGIGKALEPFSKGAVGLIKRLFGPAADEIGKWLGEIITWQLKNIFNVLDKTSIRLKETGETANEVPPKFLFRFFECASLEDDEVLVDLWAELLAAAATDEDASNPSFVDILAGLTSDDARQLEHTMRTMGNLGEIHVPESPNPSWYQLSSQHPCFINAALPNWIRLGIVERSWHVLGGNFFVNNKTGDMEPSVDLQPSHRLTPIGWKFLRACGVIKLQQYNGLFAQFENNAMDRARKEYENVPLNNPEERYRERAKQIVLEQVEELGVKKEYERWRSDRKANES